MWALGEILLQHITRVRGGVITVLVTIWLVGVKICVNGPEIISYLYKQSSVVELLLLYRT